MSKWSFCKWLCFIALPMFFAVGCSKKKRGKERQSQGFTFFGRKDFGGVGDCAGAALQGRVERQHRSLFHEGLRGTATGGAFV